MVVRIAVQHVQAIPAEMREALPDRTIEFTVAGNTHASKFPVHDNVERGALERSWVVPENTERATTGTILPLMLS